MQRSWMFVLAVVVATTQAHAEELAPVSLAMRRPPSCDTDLRHSLCTPRSPSPLRRVLATAAAIVPGVLVHGTGSYLAHDRATAKQLLRWELVGVGMMVVGGLPPGISGGNPYLIVPFVPILVAGTGIFMQTWLADIHNAAHDGAPGTPRARTPWSLELAGLWVHDAYRDRALARVTGRVVQDRLEVEAAGYVDSERDYHAGDLTARVRVLGPIAPTGEVVESGSFLDVRATTRLRDDDADRVQVGTLEAEAIGRLDLGWVSSQLAGTYAELTTGGGLERAAFSGGEDENGGLLLGRFAYGFYLGARGEAQLYYDDRRDSFAGGIAAYRAAGFVGSVGALVDARVRGPWAVHAELEIGSAWVTTLGLRYQGGPP